MDFMKWLNSLDEFLYEVASWLAFYPLTLVRVAVRPLKSMAYVEAQLELPADQQFLDGLRPPLLLSLALLTAHGLDIALGQSDALVANRHGLSGLINDDATALLLRLVVFASFPLLTGLRLLRGRRAPLNRDTLRGPFYAQCYPTAVFALLLSISVTVGQLGDRRAAAAGLITAGVALSYYLYVETRLFSRALGIGLLRGFLAAAACLLEAALLLFGIGLLLKG